MKTPMQELIDGIDNLDHKKQTLCKNGVMDLLRYYLEKEKQCIIDAWNDANMVTGIDIIETGEQYYKETFNKK